LVVYVLQRIANQEQALLDLFLAEHGNFLAGQEDLRREGDHFV